MYSLLCISISTHHKFLLVKFPFGALAKTFVRLTDMDIIYGFLRKKGTCINIDLHSKSQECEPMNGCTWMYFEKFWCLIHNYLMKVFSFLNKYFSLTVKLTAAWKRKAEQ